MGGHCSRTDVTCSASEDFVGFDPSCEPNTRCCVPRDAGGAGGGDAGSGGGAGGSSGTGGGGQATACSTSDALCWSKSSTCPTGTAQDPGTCAAGTCCATTSSFCGSLTFAIGHCIDFNSKCQPDETRYDFFINGTNCQMGEACCAVMP
jgi:hypothetical protein